jgi:hypothetical protein
LRVQTPLQSDGESTFPGAGKSEEPDGLGALSEFRLFFAAGQNVIENRVDLGRCVGH